MAQYIFYKTRYPINSSETLHKLEHISDLLTPVQIKGKSQNIIEKWPSVSESYYAIQNSDGVVKPEQNALVIGWMQQLDKNKPAVCNSEENGSYAVIKNTADQVSFFSDQFGSRTLWYYLDDKTLIVSTSQRAIVALKGAFNFNEEVLAWYLSSGCQGPFISWDQDVKQVLPHLEYKLNIADWCFESNQKLGMELPASGSTRMSDYLDLYQQQVASSLDQVINSYPTEQVLLPISGGLDSRLLLAFSKNSGLDSKVALVNWGVPGQKDIFDDKTAARLVADAYGKELLDMSLPAEIDSYDVVLDSFVEASEGRIDHFNAFVDGFKMWSEFFQHGYRVILRGDIPYPTGLCLNESEARAKLGFELLSDYSNVNDFKLQKYAELQSEYSIKRLSGESLLRWRDRVFTDLRVPNVLAAFSHQISAFTENRGPMMNWSLFKLYMGLSDKDKGNKLHIKKLWEKYDRSGVPSHAVGSLRSMNSYFDNAQGRSYLLVKLSALESNEFLSLDLVRSVRDVISKQEHKSSGSEITTVSQKARGFLSHHLPELLKAYLKSKQVKKLSATTLAYRIILAEKIINMYASDAKNITGDK